MFRFCLLKSILSCTTLYLNLADGFTMFVCTIIVRLHAHRYYEIVILLCIHNNVSYNGSSAQKTNRGSIRLKQNFGKCIFSQKNTHTKHHCTHDTRWVRMRKLCNLNVLHGCRDGVCVCDSILFRNETGLYCLPNKLNVCQLILILQNEKRKEKWERRQKRAELLAQTACKMQHGFI